MATHYDTVHLTDVASTQDESSARFDRSGRPTLVVADRQFAGRGRQGRSWEQADRALFASYTHETPWPLATRSLIPLVCGLAMRNAIMDHADIEIRLKWPNDLILEGRKLGGVLVEASGDRITAGCGVNLWWPRRPTGTAALYDDDPGSLAARTLADAWVSGLVSHLSNGPDAWHRDEYLAASSTLGQRIAWDGGEGLATGLAPDGALVVATEDGEETIHAGEVHTRR